MYVHGNQLTRTTDHRPRTTTTHFKSFLLPDCDFSNWPLQIQWLFWHPPPQIQRSSQLPPLTVSAMGAPLPILCTNCDDKQLKCKAHPHTKGLCYHCIVNGLQCLFPPITILGHASPGTTNVSLFQRNCIHCTQSYQRCVFNTDTQSQCNCLLFVQRKMKMEQVDNFRGLWERVICPTI
jgi:hypothetical protein